MLTLDQIAAFGVHDGVAVTSTELGDMLAIGTHTDRTTGHTTTVVGSSLTVVDRDGNKSTVMQ